MRRVRHAAPLVIGPAGTCGIDDLRGAERALRLKSRGGIGPEALRGVETSSVGPRARRPRARRSSPSPSASCGHRHGRREPAQTFCWAGAHARNVTPRSPASAPRRGAKRACRAGLPRLRGLRWRGMGRGRTGHALFFRSGLRLCPIWSSLISSSLMLTSARSLRMPRRSRPKRLM